MNEFEIFQNRALGAHCLWEFSKYYRRFHIEKACPTLFLVMPVLPICLNRRTVLAVKDRNFKMGSLMRVLNDHNDLFVGLQERIVEMSDLTFKSIYLGCVAGLLSFDKDDGSLIPAVDTLHKELIDDRINNESYHHILETSRRIGAWFGQLNELEILLYFRL